MHTAHLDLFGAARLYLLFQGGIIRMKNPLQVGFPSPGGQFYQCKDIVVNRASFHIISKATIRVRFKELSHDEIHGVLVYVEILSSLGENGFSH